MDALAALEHPPHPRGVDRHRLLHEHVLALIDRVLEVFGPEPGRRRQNDDVDAGVDHLAVGIKAGVAVLGRRLEALAALERPALAELSEAAVAVLHPVLERVGHRHQLDRSSRREGLGRGTRAAPSAADQADAECRVAAGTAHVRCRVRCPGRGPATNSTRKQGRRGPGDEGTPGGSVHGFSPHPARCSCPNSLDEAAPRN